MKDEATATLLQRHQITDPSKADFQVRTQQDLVAGADQVSHVLRIMLLVVAIVALLTGTLAIASLMLAPLAVVDLGAVDWRGLSPLAWGSLMSTYIGTKRRGWSNSDCSTPKRSPSRASRAPERCSTQPCQPIC